MPLVYKWLLLAIDVALPIVVFVAGNDFTSRSRTLLRAVIAILAGWAAMVGGRMLIISMEMRAARTDAEIEKIAEGDGGASAVALVLGWVPSLVLVALCWAVIRSWRAVRQSRRDGLRTSSSPMPGA